MDNEQAELLEQLRRRETEEPPPSITMTDVLRVNSVVARVVEQLTVEMLVDGFTDSMRKSVLVGLHAVVDQFLGVLEATGC